MTRIPDSVIGKVPKFTREETIEICDYLDIRTLTKKPNRTIVAYIIENWPEDKFGKYGLDGKIFDLDILLSYLDEISVQELPE